MSRVLAKVALAPPVHPGEMQRPGTPISKSAGEAARAWEGDPIYLDESCALGTPRRATFGKQTLTAQATASPGRPSWVCQSLSARSS